METSVFLIALGRMARRQRALATLCAIEAASLRSSIQFSSPQQMGPARRGYADLRRIVWTLRELKRREVSRGSLKPRPSPDPALLWLAYRRALDRFERRASNDELAKLWKELGASGLPFNALKAAAALTNPVDKALAFVSQAHDYSPESLRAIFGKHRFSLRPWPRRRRAD